MGKLKEVNTNLKRMYKNSKYLYLSIISAIISFFIFYKLTLADIANHSLDIFVKMSGYNYTYFTFLTFAIISFLFGIYFSLAVYRFHLIRLTKTKNSKGFMGLLGFFVAVFGAGCPTCGSVVFALVGAPLALMYFPFRGMELRILSIVILLISIYWISGSLTKCNVKIGGRKK